MDRIDEKLELPEIVETNGEGEEDHGGISEKKEVNSTFGIGRHQPNSDQEQLSRYHHVRDLGARPKTARSNMSPRGQREEFECFPPRRVFNSIYDRERNKTASDDSTCKWTVAALGLTSSESTVQYTGAMNESLQETEHAKMKLQESEQDRMKTYVAENDEAAGKHSIVLEYQDQDISIRSGKKEGNPKKANHSDKEKATEDLRESLTSKGTGATGGHIALEGSGKHTIGLGYQDQDISIRSPGVCKIQDDSTCKWTIADLGLTSSERTGQYTDAVNKSLQETEHTKMKLLESEQDRMKTYVAENDEAAEKINPELLSKTFKLLKEDCDKELEKKNKTDKSRQQVMSVAIFFKEELNGLIMIPLERRKVFFNEETSATIDGYTLMDKKNECHGEIIALYIEDAIEKLLKEICYQKKSPFPKETLLKKPFVFVYSKFIPCAGLLFMPYNCAEEVAKIANFYHDKCNVVVGYSDSFKYTDKELALNFLLQSKISCVFDFNLDLNEFELIHQQHRNHKTLLFQKILFNNMCLICGNMCFDEIQENVAFEVNNFVNQFLSQKNIKSSGVISTFGLNLIGQFLLSEHQLHNESLFFVMGKGLMDMMSQNRPSPINCLQFGQPINGSTTDNEWNLIENVETTKWLDLYLNLYPKKVDPPKLVSFSMKEKDFVPFIERKTSDQFGVYKHAVTSFFKRQKSKVKVVPAK